MSGQRPDWFDLSRVVTNTRPQARVLVVEAGPIMADPPGLHMANIMTRRNGNARRLPAGPEPVSL